MAPFNGALRLRGGGRKYFLAGNWKMNPGTLEEAKTLASAVRSMAFPQHPSPGFFHPYDRRGEARCNAAEASPLVILSGQGNACIGQCSEDLGRKIEGGGGLGKMRLAWRSGHERSWGRSCWRMQGMEFLADHEPGKTFPWASIVINSRREGSGQGVGINIQWYLAMFLMSEVPLHLSRFQGKRLFLWFQQIFLSLASNKVACVPERSPPPTGCQGDRGPEP